MPSKAEIKGVEDAYNTAVTSLSSFFAAVNEGVGTKRLVAVPKAGVYNEGWNGCYGDATFNPKTVSGAC